MKSVEKLLKKKLKEYGPAQENIGAWTEIITILLHRAGKLKDGAVITAQEGCLIMLAFKLNRESHKHSQDNVDDIAGYQKILDDMYYGGIK